MDVAGPEMLTLVTPVLLKVAVFNGTIAGVQLRGVFQSLVAPTQVASWAWVAFGTKTRSLTFAPTKPASARRAYDLETIRGWLEKFLFRFFTISQFKRSAIPNGPKVSAGGALSPRGDWRAPSDGTAKVWLDELKANVPG